MTDQIKRNVTFSELWDIQLLSRAAAGEKLIEIAKSEGRSRSYLSRRLNQPHHQILLRQAYDKCLTEISTRLPGLLSSALDVLEREVAKPWDGYGERSNLSAAKIITKLAFRVAQSQPQPPCACQCHCSGEKTINP